MLDTSTIESIVGKKGTMTDDVLRLTQPRQDLKVTLDGFEIVPFMGLTSWVAFRQAQHHTTMMGDIVLLEDETNAAVSAAIESDLYATALHNHFVREQPRIMFMHIEGTADEATLARGVRTVFDGIEVVRKAHPVPPSAKQVRSDLDTTWLEEVVGAKGELKEGVFKFILGRPSVPIVCRNCGNLDINAAMGYNTWAAFQGTYDRTAVCGDFAMLETEVASVIGELRAGGIEVVAIHNHMFFEDPRTIFLHYWGIGRAEDLARTFKRALDTQQRSVAAASAC